MTAFEEDSWPTLPDMQPGSVHTDSGMVEPPGPCQGVPTILRRSETTGVGSNRFTAQCTLAARKPRRVDRFGTTIRPDAANYMLRSAGSSTQTFPLLAYFLNTISLAALYGRLSSCKDNSRAQFRINNHWNAGPHASKTNVPTSESWSFAVMSRTGTWIHTPCLPIGGRNTIYRRLRVSCRKHREAALD